MTSGHFPTAIAPDVCLHGMGGGGGGGGWGVGDAGGDQTMSGQRRRKGRMKQRKSVEADRQSSLIRFLGRMTKLRGMQEWRGEREVIKSSATKREGGGKVDDRRGERGWLKNSGRPSLHLFISPRLTNSVPFLPCSCTTTNCTPTVHLSSGESSRLVG